MGCSANPGGGVGTRRGGGQAVPRNHQGIAPSIAQGGQRPPLDSCQPMGHHQRPSLSQGGGAGTQNNTLPKRPKQANPRSNLKQYLPCPKTIDLGPKQYLWASKQTPPYASLVCFNTPAPQNNTQGGLLDESVFSKQYPQGSVCAPPC